MSRSGYSDDCDGELIPEGLWRHSLRLAIDGKRGQKLLRELADAMDAMPEKALIAGELVDASGDFCALGVVGAKRGIDLSKLDPEWSSQVARAFNIADSLAREITFINDEDGIDSETPQQRWARVRRWVAKQIKEGQP